MIYIIGGVSRGGKTTLSHLLCDKYNLPYFSLDSLYIGLETGAPQLCDKWQDTAAKIARVIWPILVPMIRFYISRNIDYVFEGVWVMPHQIAQLMRKYPGQIRACYLGYPNMDLETKHKYVRKYPNKPHDWLLRQNDTYIAWHLRNSRRHSRQLQTACAKHHIEFFDIGDNFKATLNQAMRYLRKKT